MPDIETYPAANFSDYVVSLLAGITFGGVAAAVIYGALYGLEFAAGYFQLGLVENPWYPQVRNISYGVLPALIGFITGFITYKRVLRLD